VDFGFADFDALGDSFNESLLRFGLPSRLPMTPLIHRCHVPVPKQVGIETGRDANYETG